MTPDEIRKRDIEGLLESIRLAWVELSDPNLALTERQKVRGKIVFYTDELKKLVLGLDFD